MTKVHNLKFILTSLVTTDIIHVSHFLSVQYPCVTNMINQLNVSAPAIHHFMIDLWRVTSCVLLLSVLSANLRVRPIIRKSISLM